MVNVIRVETPRGTRFVRKGSRDDPTARSGAKVQTIRRGGGTAGPQQFVQVIETSGGRTRTREIPLAEFQSLQAAGAISKQTIGGRVVIRSQGQLQKAQQKEAEKRQRLAKPEDLLSARQRLIKQTVERQGKKTSISKGGDLIIQERSGRKTVVGSMGESATVPGSARVSTKVIPFVTKERAEVESKRRERRAKVLQATGGFIPGSKAAAEFSKLTKQQKKNFRTEQIKKKAFTQTGATRVLFEITKDKGKQKNVIEEAKRLRNRVRNFITGKTPVQAGRDIGVGLGIAIINEFKKIGRGTKKQIEIQKIARDLNKVSSLSVRFNIERLERKAAKGPLSEKNQKKLANLLIELDRREQRGDLSKERELQAKLDKLVGSEDRAALKSISELFLIGLGTGALIKVFLKASPKIFGGILKFASPFLAGSLIVSYAREAREKGIITTVAKGVIEVGAFSLGASAAGLKGSSTSTRAKVKSGKLKIDIKAMNNHKVKIKKSRLSNLKKEALLKSLNAGIRKLKQRFPIEEPTTKQRIRLLKKKSQLIKEGKIFESFKLDSKLKIKRITDRIRVVESELKRSIKGLPSKIATKTNRGLKRQLFNIRFEVNRLKNIVKRSPKRTTKKVMDRFERFESNLNKKINKIKVDIKSIPRKTKTTILRAKIKIPESFNKSINAKILKINKRFRNINRVLRSQPNKIRQRLKKEIISLRLRWNTINNRLRKKISLIERKRLKVKNIQKEIEELTSITKKTNKFANVRFFFEDVNGNFRAFNKKKFYLRALKQDLKKISRKQRVAGAREDLVRQKALKRFAGKRITKANRLAIFTGEVGERRLKAVRKFFRPKESDLIKNAEKLFNERKSFNQFQRLMRKKGIPLARKVVDKVKKPIIVVERNEIKKSIGTLDAAKTPPKSPQGARQQLVLVQKTKKSLRNTKKKLDNKKVELANKKRILTNKLRTEPGLSVAKIQQIQSIISGVAILELYRSIVEVVTKDALKIEDKIISLPLFKRAIKTKQTQAQVQAQKIVQKTVQKPKQTPENVVKVVQGQLPGLIAIGNTLAGFVLFNRLIKTPRVRKNVNTFNNFKRWLKRFRGKKRKFKFTPDLFSLFFGIVANRKQIARLLIRNRVFTGFEVRKIVKR